jgi:hypothetical protein
MICKSSVNAVTSPHASCLVAKDVTIYYFQTMTGIISAVLEMFNELL